MGRIRHFISEMTESIAGLGVIPAWGSGFWNGLRSLFRSTGNLFWGKVPAYDNTLVNYDLARQLYRNDGTETSLGAAFCKPIVDLQVAFIGTPRASTGDDALDDALNKCFEVFWTDEIQQAFRNAIRDSKTVVRYWQEPLLNDPFMTVEES